MFKNYKNKKRETYKLKQHLRKYKNITISGQVVLYPKFFKKTKQ